MSEGTVRGYTLISCMDYIDTFEPEQRERVYSSLPTSVPRERSAYNVVQWYPHGHLGAFYDGIASLARDDEKKALQLLVACGQFVALSATNSFMKLVMRILTPSIFAKKAPDFWSRDHRIGEMSSDTSRLDDKRIVVTLRGVKELMHAGPVAKGFCEFAMTSMGVKGLDVRLEGWSLANPSGDEVKFHISWS